MSKFERYSPSLCQYSMRSNLINRKMGFPMPFRQCIVTSNMRPPSPGNVPQYLPPQAATSSKGSTAKPKRSTRPGRLSTTTPILSNLRRGKTYPKMTCFNPCSFLFFFPRRDIPPRMMNDRCRRLPCMLLCFKRELRYMICILIFFWTAAQLMLLF